MAIDKNCKVTNNSGAAVVALNAFNSSTNVAANSPKQGYMQQLKLLTSGANATIGDGADATIVLDETYVDSTGKTQPCYIYDLLFSKPDSLFPVAVQAEMLDFAKQSYPDITLTSAQNANMAKALAFCQNIMTSPTSKMSVAFQAAMTNALKESSIAKIEAAMSAFWNQYPVFAGLDFKSYVAVSTYLRAFAYLWGMNDKGEAGQTYYVYASSGGGDSSSGGVTNTGKIVFSKKSNAPSPADPSDPNSGFDITYTPSSGSPTTLTFDNGQLIDGSGAIALNGGFGFKGTFTNDTGDTTVWPVFSGTVLNLKAMVIPLAPESGWDKFWSSLSFEKLLNYFLQGMGVWMAIDFLKQKLTGKEKKLADDKANKNEGGEPDKQQQQDADESADKVGEAAQKDDQDLADRAAPNDEVKVADNQQAFDDAVENVRGEGSAAYKNVAEDNLKGGIESANQQIEDLAEIEVTPALEEAGTNLANAQSSLESGDLSSAADSLGSVNEALPQIVDDMGSSVSSELKEQVNDAVEVQDRAKDISEETEESSEKSGTGDEEPFDDPTLPVE
jgi:hypothetical protein